MNLTGFGACIFLAALAVSPASAKIDGFPLLFHTQMVKSGDAEIYVRVGGKGPAVVLLHGFGEPATCGRRWPRRYKDHTVIVPDLRGMGLSSHPPRIRQEESGRRHRRGHGQAQSRKGRSCDARYRQHGRLCARRSISRPHHQMGRDRRAVSRHRAWDEILQSPLLWHFNFRGPDVERLVKGRERIYLDRFYNELSANPKAIDEATREHYAKLYARPGNMHDAFEQFAAFKSGRHRQQGVCGQGQTDDADPGARRRKIVWRTAGRRSCARSAPMLKAESSLVRVTGSWRRTRADRESGEGISRKTVGASDAARLFNRRDIDADLAPTARSVFAPTLLAQNLPHGIVDFSRVVQRFAALEKRAHFLVVVCAFRARNIVATDLRADFSISSLFSDCNGLATVDLISMVASWA